MVYMFGKYARDGMIELGGVDTFATALAGAQFTALWLEVLLFTFGIIKSIVLLSGL